MHRVLALGTDMKRFNRRDTVAFDIFCATGTGWVDNPRADRCNIVLSTFTLKKGFEEKWNELEEKGIFDDFLSDISYECLKEIKEEEWTDDFRYDYVANAIKDNPNLDILPETEKERVRKNLDILCSHDVWAGLLRKGYLCYGGSSLYECDWQESRRCFERCMELKSDTSVANTLGYIYYYGRCSDGKPDYDKAYRYFSMAALGGNHESLYKTGDMFLKGLGVPKNEELADELYERVYCETKHLVLNGNNRNNFADAALRMAGLYERQEYDSDSIYGKYLEADLGLKIRQPLNYYGDNFVRKSVDAGLERFKPQKEVSVLHDENASFAMFMTEDNIGNNLVKVVIERKGQEIKGSLELVDSISKIRNKTTYLMLTIPQLSYCGFIRSYSFRCTVMEDGNCDFEEGETTIFCTQIENLVCEALFFTDDDRVMSLESNSWIMRKPTKKDEYSPVWDAEPDLLDDEV